MARKAKKSQTKSASLSAALSPLPDEQDSDEESVISTLNLLSNGVDDSVLAAKTKSLTACRYITMLLFRSNKITDVGMTALAQALKNNTTVKEIYLDLGWNKVGIAGWTSFSAALARNTSVETLTISNSLSDDGAVVLFEAVKSNATLVKLDLGNNSIGQNGAAMLAEALECNTSLSTLDLSYNAIRDVEYTALLCVLKECNISLTRIEIDFDWFGSPNADAISKVVSANRAGIRLVHAHGELDLSSKAFREHAEILSEDLATNTTVTVLNLGSNWIYDDGVVHIANTLAKKNHTLVEIRLSDNGIAARGALALASVLRENATLQVLDLSNNFIGDGGARALFPALKRNTSLTKLALGSNGFGIGGVVADALTCNTSLATLDLSCNCIEAEGAMVLLKALQGYNNTLLKLNLEGNRHISPGFLDVIDSMLASRRFLRFLVNNLQKPINERVIPYVIRAMPQCSLHCKKPLLTHCPEAAGNAGSIYYLTRAAVSKIVGSACLR
jgi:Ran GTPase-activating protein (RanGAP) involved in mRNA processing and transport